MSNLRGSDLDTGLDPSTLTGLNTYWENVRAEYVPFESGQLSTSSDVYVHEIPGGQYTNLKFQATSLGLAEAWDDVKVAYATANRMLGAIPKVTPSSKVVGDLAQFIVSSGKTEQEIVDQAEQLSFPSSLVDYMQGMQGQPPARFPEPLRSRVLGDKPRVEGRPGASLPPANLSALRQQLDRAATELAQAKGQAEAQRQEIEAHRREAEAQRLKIEAQRRQTERLRREVARLQAEDGHCARSRPYYWQR